MIDTVQAAPAMGTSSPAAQGMDCCPIHPTSGNGPLGCRYCGDEEAHRALDKLLASAPRPPSANGLKHCSGHPKCQGPHLIVDHATQCPDGNMEDCDNDTCWVPCPYCVIESPTAKLSESVTEQTIRAAISKAMGEEGWALGGTLTVSQAVVACRALLASAPPPSASADVEAIRKRLSTAILALNLVPRTSDADHPIRRAEEAIDSIGGPLKRLEAKLSASLERAEGMEKVRALLQSPDAHDLKCCHCEWHRELRRALGEQ